MVKTRSSSRSTILIIAFIGILILFFILTNLFDIIDVIIILIDFTFRVILPLVIIYLIISHHYKIIELENEVFQLKFKLNDLVELNKLNQA